MPSSIKLWALFLDTQAAENIFCKTTWIWNTNLLSIMESASGDGCEAYVRASVWFYKGLNGLYVIGVKCSILETTR